MRLSRRGFLGALGVSALGATSLGTLVLPGRSGQTAELVRSAAKLPEPFRVPLPIPPVAKTVRDGYYEITQREAEVEILPGLRTRIWGYDGIFPGPTIVTRAGRPTVVRHRTELPEPTAVHLHGGHTPADSDGYPVDLLVPPGSHSGHPHNGNVATGSREYTYPGRQRAATLWYHDHAMDRTGPNVYRGLAGFHLIHDDEDDALPLPRGDRDLPLMITDRAFEEDGSFRYPGMSEGVLGDVILVNGAPWPVHEVAAARYRLRILNASNARRYRLSLGIPMVQIGSDGGLLGRPVSHDELVIAPGERFEVVVDFTEHLGAELTLHNGLDSGSTADVMRFRVTARGSDDSRVPEVLSRVERLDPGAAVRTREWRFSRGEVNGNRHGWLVNGAVFDPDRADATPRLGEVEIWRFITDLHHPVHVHLDPFQVISRHGKEPGPYDAGWKDTVDIGPTDWVDVAVRFTDYTGRFMLHCHNLEHEDMAMMAAFDTR
jgi:spore coat protein A, manganese oxidase